MINYNDYRGFNLNETLFPVNEYGFKLARWYWKGTDRFRSYQLTAGMVDNLLDSVDKTELPQVDFTSNAEFHCVIADFDELPKFFDHWGEFHRYMEQAYPTACVTTSASGKLKAVFLVQNVKHIDHLATLRSIIKPELHSYLDTSPTALTKTYLTVDMIRDIKAWLKTATVHEPVNKQFSEIDLHNLAQEYIDLGNDLSTILRTKFTKKLFKSLTDEKLLKLSVLLVSDALTLSNEGVIWNQQIFGRVIGVGDKTAAKILNSLQEFGFIHMVKNYSAGNISRTYVACGDLWTFFEENGLNHSETVTITGSTIKSHKLNKLIASILPPEYAANKYYLKVAKYLTKRGFCETLVAKVLYDIDQRRPKMKQRPRAYFNSLGLWSSRRYA